MKQQKNQPSFTALPILCGDVHLMQNKQLQLSRNRLSDIEALRHLQKIHGWHVALDTLLSREYEALVLTDHRQRIQWVNEGFHDMTGYAPDFALGKKPDFLQGRDTNTKALRDVKLSLQEGKDFQTTIINYRANGEAYLCQVAIFPLHDAQQQLTHYLALEKERAWD